MTTTHTPRTTGARSSGLPIDTLMVQVDGSQPDPAARRFALVLA